MHFCKLKFESLIPWRFDFPMAIFSESCDSMIGGDTQQVTTNDRLLAPMGMLAICDRRFSFLTHIEQRSQDGLNKADCISEPTSRLTFLNQIQFTRRHNCSPTFESIHHHNDLCRSICTAHGFHFPPLYWIRNHREALLRHRKLLVVVDRRFFPSPAFPQ